MKTDSAPPLASEMPIAIIGMACIFPKAPDLRAFWNNILGLVDAIGTPVAEWDAQRYLDSGRIKTPFGGYLGDLYRFDPREFGIMPNSIDGSEPDQFLALRVARDALLDAGYLRPDFDHRDTGVILGHSTYLHRGQGTLVQNNIVLDQTIELLRAVMPDLPADRLQEVSELLRAKLPPTNADTVPGLVPNVMTGRIANRLNLQGPNYLVDAACSSSLLAVNAAMDELRAGRSRLMLAGGVNASLPAEVSTIFTQLGALSTRGKVRPFENGSDGTLLGEGLGVVVLKRLDEAMADQDRIYAVLRGVGQASDGRGTGLLAPSVGGETLSIQRAYASTGIDPASVGLIEAHGTGIPLGDKTEIAALKSVLGERKGPQGTVALGSVKSLISHCIPAAGIAGLIKASLAIHHGVLPPTLCDEVNPELGIDKTPMFINKETMPWIVAPGAVRRAGVDSFGFGGINTHAIVEQAPAQARRPDRLSAWPFELCVLSAPDVQGLGESLKALQASLAGQPAWRLDEIAAGLSRRAQNGAVRLAMVVKDRESLDKAIESALKRLAGGEELRWSARSRIHFDADPNPGKVAFLFPGEGSQYLGMFGDLAQHFEPVRDWLGFWRGLYQAEPGGSRTDIVFPPTSELSPERRRALEARLNDMDVGSEAVMVGGQAMFALLQSLGVSCEAMLGHSSGESSALAASGAFSTDPQALADSIREMNTVYQRVLGEGHIAQGALLAVGALPAADVDRVLAEAGGEVQVAMDNCANQRVLFGSPAAIERVQAALTSIGGICMPLPFNRGYHTPSFEAVSTAFLGFYKKVGLGAPKRLLYSCASTGPFPTTPGAARKLAAAQWSQTVRFRETVQRMHADGFRTFVEVGPSANLTGFVGDILSGQDHVALATNVRRKGGVEQLLDTLGRLYVLGVWNDVTKLFDSRGLEGVDLDAPVRARTGGALLDNTMPSVRFSPADISRLQELTRTASPPPAPELLPPAPVEAPPPQAVHEDGPNDRVMADYFDMMRSFLAHQQSAIEMVHAPQAPRPEDALGASLPFLDQVLQQDETQVHASCRLSLHHDTFLRDHVLSGRVSDVDPELLGLSCVPLMVSLEIMAEAAALLSGSPTMAAIENVRAFDWIALDREETSLEVRAEYIEGAPGPIRTTLLEAGQVKVTAVFHATAEARLPSLPELAERRAARYNGRELYEEGMFHGPVFRSLEDFDGWDAQGMDARLSPCSLVGFFEPGVPSSMVLNPVLLDAIGQLAANWIVQHIGTDFNCFPSQIARIEIYESCPGDEAGLRLLARQQPLDASQAGDIAATRSWDFECLAADGRPLLRVGQLVNVFFPVPHAFYQVRRDPLNGLLGQALPYQPAPDLLVWELELLPEDFCAQSAAIFLRILAHATLSYEERAEWQSLQGSLRHKRQWLLGRACLKEAVRVWLAQRTGHWLYPSDVVVLHDALGAPLVHGWWVDSLAAAPAVSLSHDDRCCLAAVRDAGSPAGVDVETLGTGQRPGLLEQALTPSERAQLAGLQGEALEERLLKVWSAKEAAAKAFGRGFEGAPDRFEVSFLNENQSAARVDHQGESIGVFLARRGPSVVAVVDSEPIEDR